MNLIQTAEGLKRKSEVPKEEGLLPLDGPQTWAATWWLHLQARPCPADFQLASPYNHVGQFLPFLSRLSLYEIPRSELIWSGIRDDEIEFKSQLMAPL